jgi:hypothetical protein
MTLVGIRHRETAFYYLHRTHAAYSGAAAGHGQFDPVLLQDIRKALSRFKLERIPIVSAQNMKFHI